MIRSIVSLLGIAGAIALFFLYTQPTYDQVKTLQAQMAEYDLALLRAADLKKLKDTRMARYNAFKPEDIQRLEKLLPNHVDNVRLVLDLDTMASQQGLALQNVVISGTGAGAVEATVITTIGQSSSKYDSRGIRFATEGTYEQLNNFLRDLEMSLRIVDLEALTLDRVTNDPGQEPTYRFDVSVKTYWLK